MIFGYIRISSDRQTVEQMTAAQRQPPSLATSDQPLAN